MLTEQESTKRKKVESLVKEEKGLFGLKGVLNEGWTTLKKFMIETNSKNTTLKELEINRKESIEKIEELYNKTDSYLAKKRFFDIANEINEKYQYAVEEVENVYASNKSIDEKLGNFEEIKTVTNAYYRLITEEAERMKITSS